MTSATTDAWPSRMAAAAAIREGQASVVALVIAAESTANLGRPGEARMLAGRALELNAGPIDRVFAGMPRAAIWPADPIAPRTATRLPGGTERRAAERGRGAGRSAAGPFDAGRAVPAGDHGRRPLGPGLWDHEADADEVTLVLPDAADELDAGRDALGEGDIGQAAIRLGLVLRLAPALAPAVIEVLDSALGAEVEVVRGDAYHLVGHEREARQAYAAAAAEISERARRRLPTPRADMGDESEDPGAHGPA